MKEIEDLWKKIEEIDRDLSGERGEWRRVERESVRKKKEK